MCRGAALRRVPRVICPACPTNTMQLKLRPQDFSLHTISGEMRQAVIAQHAEEARRQKAARRAAAEIERRAQVPSCLRPQLWLRMVAPDLSLCPATLA